MKQQSIALAKIDKKGVAAGFQKGRGESKLHLSSCDSHSCDPTTELISRQQKGKVVWVEEERAEMERKEELKQGKVPRKMNPSPSSPSIRRCGRLPARCWDTTELGEPRGVRR